MTIFQMSSDFIAPQLGFFEPQRRNHYSVEFHLPSVLDQQLLTLSIVRGALPNEGNEEIELPWKNESVWVAGRRTLDAGTFAVRDFVDRNSYGAVQRWRGLVYQALTGRVGYAADYKVTGFIVMTGPDGLRNTRLWQLIGCWPKNVNGGDLADDSNEVVELETEIRYDKAIPLFATAIN